MRFWIVQKDETVEAIIEAISAGKCETEGQVEEIAAKLGDSVKWAGGS